MWKRSAIDSNLKGPEEKAPTQELPSSLKLKWISFKLRLPPCDSLKPAKSIDSTEPSWTAPASSGPINNHLPDCETSHGERNGEGHRVSRKGHNRRRADGLVSFAKSEEWGETRGGQRLGVHSRDGQSCLLGLCRETGCSSRPFYFIDRLLLTARCVCSTSPWLNTLTHQRSAIHHSHSVTSLLLWSLSRGRVSFPIAWDASKYDSRKIKRENRGFEQCSVQSPTCPWTFSRRSPRGTRSIEARFDLPPITCPANGGTAHASCFTGSPQWRYWSRLLRPTPRSAGFATGLSLGEFSMHHHPSLLLGYDRPSSKIRRIVIEVRPPAAAWRSRMRLHQLLICAHEAPVTPSMFAPRLTDYRYVTEAWLLMGDGKFRRFP